MKQCLIIGQANVGKTAFALGFAEFLGVEKLEITFSYPDGFSTKQNYALSIAKQELVGPQPHKTRALQAMELSIPVGKGRKTVKLIDSAGLGNGVHEDPEVRRSMVQTLQAIRNADLILHMVDAAQVGRQEDEVQPLSEVDRQVVGFGQNNGQYVILANKMDQSSATKGLGRLQSSLPNQKIIPISALTQAGFKEVRIIVARSI